MTRVHAIAAYIAPPDLRDDVAQESLQKLQSMISSSSYLRSVVRSSLMDWYRKTGREVPAAPELPSPVPPHEPEAPVSVIEARLRLVYGSGENRPHEALAFGYQQHLGYSPADIVGNLARLRLADLAHSFVDEYAFASGIGGGHAADLFSGLLAVAEAPEGRKRLSEYWDPAGVVADWLQPNGSAANGLHHRIARLFCDELGYTAETVVARLGRCTLEELAVRFIDEKSAADGIARDQTQARFAAALDTNPVAASRSLAFYYSPARAVAHWTETVSRRLEAAEGAVEKQAIRLLAGFGPPLETLSFVLTFMLRVPAEEIARRFSREPASAAVEWAAAIYASRREIGMEQARWWLRPLCKQIDATRPLAANLDRNLAMSVSSWRGDLLKRFLPAVESRPDLLLFRWRYGMLRGVRCTMD